MKRLLCILLFFVFAQRLAVAQTNDSLVKQNQFMYDSMLRTAEFYLEKSNKDSAIHFYFQTNRYETDKNRMQQRYVDKQLGALLYPVSFTKLDEALKKSDFVVQGVLLRN